MFKSAFRYLLRQPVRALAAIASEPLEAWARFEEGLVHRRERRASPNSFNVEENWERRLHEWLGVPWPCPATSAFWKLWPEVMDEIKAKGIRVSPDSFLGSNDGDAGFVRAIWCLARHLRPRNVVETGVAHGVTSRFILEALEWNEVGHLWSIDRPPLDPVWHKEIGIAVGGRHSARWSYVRGTSRLHLPKSFPSLARSTFSFTTACTASTMFALRWTASGLFYPLAVPLLLMT